MSDPKQKTVLVTGVTGYIGNAVARAFVRAGWSTYGLVRKESAIASLAAQEIIPILGSPANPSFLKSLNEKRVVFDVIASVTEDILNYVSHYDEIIILLRAIAITSNATGVRPLVLFTSGCKDYGMMDKLADSPNLSPHTEESPLNPPPFAQDRAYHARKTAENEDLFDTIVLRPTNVYGLSSSYYGDIFKLAADAAKKGVLELSENPKTILHALHVDDCGEAYEQLASYPDRGKIIGREYNISSYRYETLEEIAQELVKEYQIPGGVRFVSPDPTAKGPDVNVDRMLLGFSQWTGSERLRTDIGWRDRKALFSKALHQYRLAYEASVKSGYTPLYFWQK